MRDLTRSLDDCYGDSGNGGAGLPDDVAAEIEAAFPNDGPSDAELEEEYHRWNAGIRPADWHDDDPTPPAGGGALPPMPLPDFSTYGDDALVAAIGLADDESDPLALHEQADA